MSLRRSRGAYVTINSGPRDHEITLFVTWNDGRWHVELLDILCVLAASPSAGSRHRVAPEQTDRVSAFCPSQSPTRRPLDRVLSTSFRENIVCIDILAH
jgi:hypothetical protein